MLQLLDPLLHFLTERGFQQQEAGDARWRVSLRSVGNEARVCLNDELGVILAATTQRPMRWLAASLTFSASMAAVGLGEEEKVEQEARDRPLTMRLYIQSQKSLEPNSKLMKRLKLFPLLVRRAEQQGCEVVQVGEEFAKDVGHVRKVITTAFVGQLESFRVRVEILDVTWWAGWDNRLKKFRSHGQHQEVEVHAEDISALSGAGAKKVEEFVKGMWHAGLTVSDLIL